MVQTKCERQKIGEVIELLHQISVRVWTDITLSQENIDIWPEGGRSY